MSERTPTPCEGRKVWKGKRKPVRLVANVLDRNVMVQRLYSRERRSPRHTSKPDAMPMRLITTWKTVNIANTILIGTSEWKMRPEVNLLHLCDPCHRDALIQTEAVFVSCSLRLGGRGVGTRSPSRRLSAPEGHRLGATWGEHRRSLCAVRRCLGA